MQPVSTQRRLSVWRFLLACAMGLVASLVIHWLLAPKPAWMIHVTSNEMRYHPICEDASGRWLLVSEERNQQGRYQESAILILNAATGDILYRLDEEAQCLNLNMLEPHERYPRLIGEALFRFKRIATDSGIRHELRRWNFTQSRQEELIQAWTVPPRVPFEVTFAPDDSPYFLIQTICPWQMGIVTLGVDTWTALTNSMTWAHYLKDPYGTPIAISPNGLQEPRAGWNPWIETFALPTGEAPVLKKLASWTLPPLRWTWPPSVGPRLDWVTFGDSALPVGWKSSKRWIHPDRGGVMPQGVLLFDGHTGQQRAVEVLPEYQNQLFTTSSMGDHFWIHHLVRRPTLIDAEYQCLSGATGRLIQTPQNLLHVFRFACLDKKTPGLLVFGRLKNKPQSPDLYLDSLQLVEVSPSEMHLRKEVSLELHANALPNGIVSLVHGNQLACSFIQDGVPDPNAPWYLRIWNAMTQPEGNRVYLFDIGTGHREGFLKGRSSLRLRTQGNSERLYTFVDKDLNGTSLFRKNLEAWNMPIRFYSPWWSRLAGMVIFLLSLRWLVVRRRGLTPLTQD